MCDDYTEKEKRLMKIVNPKKYEELYPEIKEDTKKEEEPAAE